MMMEVDDERTTDEHDVSSQPRDDAEMVNLATRLLHSEELPWFVSNHRTYLPELLHTAARLPADSLQQESFLVLCGKLVRLSPHLVQHVEPHVLDLQPPWQSAGHDGQPEVKRRRRSDEDREDNDVDVYTAVLWLLRRLRKLRSVWDWSGLFTTLTGDSSSHLKIVCLEILRHLITLTPENIQILRNKVCSEVEWSKVLFQLYAEDWKYITTLTRDTDEDITGDILEERYVVRLDHVSLPKIGHHRSQLIHVPSTKDALVRMAESVSLGRAVLLRGQVGTGKTSLVTELANLTGRSNTDVLTLQISDSTDARLLLGLYRCTDIPGRFVWEPGVLTRAVQTGSWICIEDVDRAQQDVLALLASLVQTGKLTVPNLGGSIVPETGFQLFMTERTVGTLNNETAFSDIAKISKAVNVAEFSREEVQQVIANRFTSLVNLLDKILRLYEIARENSGSENIKSQRPVSFRDLVRWCERVARISIHKDNQHQAGEQLYLDAIDCFCKFIPSSSSRSALSEELAYTLNISKERASYYTSIYKPQVNLTSSNLQVGRVSLSRQLDNLALPPIYSLTRHSAVLLETVARAVEQAEPVLLVGETGVGKTAGVQFLADRTGRRLRVINMNQQSDSVDLLGGYKPVDIAHTMHNILQIFNKAFNATFANSDNSKFLGHLSTCYLAKRWSDALILMSHSLQAALKKLKTREDGESIKLKDSWGTLGRELKTVSEILKQSEKTTIFAFIEGLLTRAVKEGHWILLDEVNMATPETLECLSSLLDLGGSVCLYEKGDYQSVPRHPEFRLFACMNPATDTGKHDLPPGLRNRFTEIYVDEIRDVSDIQMLVTDYLRNLSLSSKQISNIVTFFQNAKTAATSKLTTGTGDRPTFSLRTLCRALKVANRNPCGNVTRSLYEGFSLSFLTELDKESYSYLESLLQKYIIPGKEAAKLLRQSIPAPQSGSSWHRVEGFWISGGQLEAVQNEKYILTNQVSSNLRDLARVVSLCDHPVLIQGDTSVGKTSLVSYLAALTGNKCVRVNNHEHTDIQEYIGSYTSDQTGKLVFKHGVLAEAMLQGSWVILDELNLAPTDVLEALNRVLDDNRQLYIPETQETITAAPGFRLFGTQNPPGMYGGRKVLSKAFKNRFVELHFNQLPSDELEIILKDRCGLPKTYAKKMIEVLSDLQKYRRMSAAFAGKQGFITLRDLFRWAERYRLSEDVAPGKFYDWEQHIAEEGFLLLAARIRNSEETQIVLEILEKVFKRKVLPDNLFSLHEKTSQVTLPILEKLLSVDIPGLAWTYDMRRMCVLIAQAWRFQEPVLLVGETGCGKTTAVQVLTKIQQLGLSILNCHRHTESADFLGGLRPDRGAGGEKKSGLNFCWIDGPLVTSMRQGAVFLADEISLADDSVIERLNSVLEPERQVLLAEKIDSHESQVVTAAQTFKFVGTMNPGGDYGKKELSPALKNRFTEIWCPSIDSEEQILSIATKNLVPEATKVASDIVKFVQWLRGFSTSSVVVSIRDILAWINFINGVIHTESGSKSDVVTPLNIQDAVIQGAHLVWLDGLQMDGTSSVSSAHSFQVMCENKLRQLMNTDQPAVEQHLSPKLVDTEDMLCVHPFAVRKDRSGQASCSYIFETETTTRNVLKILRALQIQKPVLLEGSPGIGKSSLVESLAKKIGQPLVRINLSDQTDISDLFGSDLPVEGGAVGQFAWRNGPFLDALQSGAWILLDELNLASQSVLEGLNAVFDHRGEVYIPELDLTFPLNPNTRIFGCQNPLSEGGDRKGLPKSFLNRFSKVYMSTLTEADYRLICLTLHPDLGQDLITRMVDFNQLLEDQVVKKKIWGQSGAPWEFNLRDLLRWCDAIKKNRDSSSCRGPDGEGLLDPGKFVRILYSARFRRKSDQERVLQLYTSVFGPEYQLPDLSGQVSLETGQVKLGGFQVARQGVLLQEEKNLVLLNYQRKLMELISGCVVNKWPVILTGQSDAGKSSLVSLLTQLCSRKLYTISLNSSSDTMDLLGGFEQADVGNSILDLFSHLNNATSSLIQKLIKTDTSTSIGFMEDFLCLTSKFHGATQEKKRKQQFVILQDMVHLINTHGVTSHQHLNFQKTLDELKTQSKHGTFEWIESTLCQALKEGSWLVIDNVNLCSASVLDRLNALFEQGGKLTVSERGVLDGQVPEIVPHPDFRVFMLYDPSRGDISRAMRNRGVEIYIPTIKEVNLSQEDSMSLVNAYLGSAVGSRLSLDKYHQLDLSHGLQVLCDDISLTSLKTLCGLVPDEVELQQNQSNENLPTGWCVSGSRDWCVYPDLAAVINQLLPVCNLSCHSPQLGLLAFQHFMCFLTLADIHLRYESMKLVLENRSLDEVFQLFVKNKLFIQFFEKQKSKQAPLDARMKGEVVSKETSSITNILQIILSMFIRFKQLQESVNQTPRCLLSTASSSFTVHSPILEQFPNMIRSMLKAIETCLNESGKTVDVTDSTWLKMDSFLFWMFELCQLGLETPDFDKEEQVERLVYVYWSWVKDRLHVLPDNTSSLTVFTTFNNMVQDLDYDCDTFSKFRQSMRSLPDPPETKEQLALAVSLATLDHEVGCLESRDRLLFLINSHQNIVKLLHNQEVKQDKRLLISALQQCIQLVRTWVQSSTDSDGTCNAATFHKYQLHCLQLRILDLMCASRTANGPLLPLSWKVEAGGNDFGDEARRLLHQLSSPAKDVLKFEHDVTNNTIVLRQEEASNYNVAAILFQMLNSGRGFSLSAHEHKEEQMREIVASLKQVKSVDRLSELRTEFNSEMQIVLSSLSVHYGQEIGGVQDFVKIPDHNINKVLESITTLGSDSEVGLHASLALVNLVKFFVYTSLGAIDPAERKVLEFNQTDKHLQYVKDQIKVIERYKEHIGTVHPHLPVLKEACLELTERVQQLVCRKAERPSSGFNVLSNTVRQFRSGPGSVDTVVKVISDLTTPLHPASQTVSEARVWLISATKFAKDLLNPEVAGFPDLVLPVMEAISRCILSVQSVVDRKLEALRHGSQDLTTMVLNLSESSLPPSLNMNQTVQFWLRNGSRWQDEKLKYKILKTALLVMVQGARQAPEVWLDPAGVRTCARQIILLWKYNQSVKLQKKVDAESLYKVQTVLCEDEDEVGLQKEFKQMFPDFSEEFADIAQDFQADLESTMETSEEDEKQVKSRDSCQLLDEVLRDISRFIVEQFSKPQNLKLGEARRDFFDRMKMVCSSMVHEDSLCTQDLEIKLMPALITYTNKFMTKNETEDSEYNFYLDENESECKLLMPLLSAIQHAIDKLLQGFPENPVLLQILKIKDRILLFPMTCPLSKCLTGLELLLAACQEWEKNAHKGVSIQSLMDTTSNLILRWRKLELSNWKSVLKHTLAGVRQATLSDFTIQILEVVFERHSGSQRVQLVRTVIQFIEAANLADFQARLDILQACLYVLKKSGEGSRRWLISALTNLHKYYSRFTESIEGKLGTIHKDCDKKITEFIKMSRWKDTNFWSVKNMVDKTRKILHKTIREYKKSVLEACNHYLVDESSHPPTEQVKLSISTAKIQELRSLTDKSVKNILEVKNARGEVIGDYSKMTNRAYKLTEKILVDLEETSLASNLSDLTPEIIREVDILQNLDVNRKKSKDEQKKEAGFIQQRKRRALNDLFKSLQGLGLSYRYGMISCSEMSTHQELFVMEESLNPCALEKYFFRCWARYRQLMPLLDKQLPEGIGPMLTDRFQGFSQHCLHSLTSWRQSVLKYTSLYNTLSLFSSEVKSMAAEGRVYPATIYRSCLDSVIVELVTVTLVFQQFCIDFPEVDNAETVLTSIKSVLDSLNTRAASAPSFFVKLSEVQGLADLGEDLNKVVVKMEDVIRQVNQHPVADRLRSLRDKLKQASEHMCARVDNYNKKLSSDETSNILDETRQTLSSSLFKCLLGIQSMVKLSKSFSAEEQWLVQVNKMFSDLPTFKLATLTKEMKTVSQALNLVPEVLSSHQAVDILGDLAGLLDCHLASLQGVLDTCVLVTRELAKLLSVLLNIFCTLAVKGFCPIKGFEDVENQSNDMEFKSSEEETGLGDGEGSKDVSDQIDNEDMLDGAYDPKEKKEEEEKNHEEEENGIEMSENFDSNLQDKKEEQGEDDDKEDKEQDLQDEVGEVEGHEELDKEMWADQDNQQDEEDQDLGESKEQGNTEEEVSEELSSNDKPDSNNKEGEKRQRKEEEEKENEEQEFDDNQVDSDYMKENEYPEPEQMDLPEDMQMETEEQEEHFEEPQDDNEPDVLPDFEDDPADLPDKDEDADDNKDDQEEANEESAQVDQFGLDDNPDVDTEEQGGEDEESVQVKDDAEDKDKEDTVAAEDNKVGKDSVQNDNEFDQSKKEESEGMNQDSQNKNSEDKSFNVTSDSRSENSQDESSGKGTEKEQEKTLADDSTKGERLELVEGNMTGEEGHKNADLFQHVMDKRDEDRSAMDKADDKVKDQVFTQDFEMETEEDKEARQEVERVKEENSYHQAPSKGERSEVDPESEKEKSAEDREERDKQFVDTVTVSRGTDSVIVRQDAAALPVNMQVDVDTSLSLQQISLTDSEENNSPVLTQLSHSLSEQLRLILNPTKASSLQGDFRTGKRLNMRKIIPFIASDFKKDKIWLRRTKPTKREFQILIALDDSSSMSDNKSRQIALESLNTISSALSLLEAGQIGVLRFGESAEVVHPLNQQWSQAAGHKIQNQFKFDQKLTSVISLLSLATAVFHRHRSSSSTQTAVSQLLVIISDGRGIFHEGKEKVIQSVVNSRCAGYFCLYLIVENPDNKDSVLDIRQPVFNSKGQLDGIQSYMDSFPFQHYIILRDVENLPATLSDALRQWFQLVCAQT